MKTKPEISNINGLLEVVHDTGLNRCNYHKIGGKEKTKYKLFGFCYCPNCGNIQRHEIKPMNWNDSWYLAPLEVYKKERRHSARTESIENSFSIRNDDSIKKHGSSKEIWYREFIESKCPLLFQYLCLNCESYTTVTVYIGPDGLDIVMLREVYGGISTPNTNKNVKYYLDQAFRAKVIGAKSAAVAMYRAALEMLFFHEGYKKGMLGDKIRELEDQKSKGNAPDWANNIDIEVLTLLKEIGDGAIHPNDGDTGKQKVIDDDLLINLEGIVTELLSEVYEIPMVGKEKKAKLKTARNTLKP